MQAPPAPVASPRPHPRVLGATGATALAMGGSNQSLFLLTALVATQGSAAVPLLILGLLMSWAAAPGWTELTLMWPDRVGGISATCAEAFRPYSPVLSNLTGTCYWWGWVPTCGITAILSASALHTWYLPGVPVTALAVGIVAAFTVLNLLGIGRVTPVVTAMAAVSALLAVLSAVLPVLHGDVDTTRALTWDLAQPFRGVFGSVSSAMAGLYLIGFAAPAFEAAACHVGEMKDPVRSLPRAMAASGGMAAVYFVALPVVWLGVFGAPGLSDANGVQLATALGPTFAPLLGGLAKGAAVWFMVINMFHGTVQPLAGASRTLSQLAEDGLLPVSMTRRNRFDVPWVATTLTATFAVVFLLAGDPVWMIAAANFTYLISICLPSVAVWLLRRNQPDWHRPWRAPRGTITLGLLAAIGWFVSTLLGFRQFGLPVVLFGLVLAYSGAALQAWRIRQDRRKAGRPRVTRSLHLKLTGAMIAVMVLDGAGYALAVASVGQGDTARAALLEDIFVGVAVLTIGVGLVLPGMIAHSATEMTQAARRLTEGTLRDLTSAMRALGAGDLAAARAEHRASLVAVTSRDEVGAMAEAFNDMQVEVERAAVSLDHAREALQRSRLELEHLARHDSLTGLPNRLHLEREIDRVLAQARRTSSSGAVLLCDLDGFKYINDSYGHAVGDDVLRAVATTLQSVVRPGDVVGRLGGDEFAAVLPGADAQTAQALASAVLAGLRETPVHLEGTGIIRVTASVGLAVVEPGSHATAHEVLVDADVAMYGAKDAGRDRLAVCCPEAPDQADLRQRHTWVQRIQHALDTDALVLHAQPILDLATSTVTRYELLLRMLGDDGQLILPGQFVPVAERAGLVTQLDHWVLREACRLLGERQRAGEDITFCVNVSGPSMGDPELLELIERELAALPRRGGLVLEVTETAAITDLGRARAFAEHLQTLGCQLALDDFGAGYGSFYYLKHLPFQCIKIDGEFVRGLVRSDADQAIVASLVSIARRLGKRTVAEFVEDAATLDLLRSLGVDGAQGWHVGRPAPLPPSTAPGPRPVPVAAIPSPRTGSAAPAPAP